MQSSSAQKIQQPFLYRNKLASLGFTTSTLASKKHVVKDTEEVFITYTPLPGSVASHAMSTTQTKSGFLDYLRGDLNEEELMYIRNFPTLYDNLPEPKKMYLQMYIREAKGELPQQTDQFNGDDSFYDNDDDDDYMDEEEFQFRLRSSQQKSVLITGASNPIANGVTTSQATTPSSQSLSKKKLKSVGFFDINNGNTTSGAPGSNLQPPPQLQSRSTMHLINSQNRKSVVLDKVSSMQHQRLATMKSIMETQAEKQQKTIMKNHINRSIGNLKAKIYNNIALRKGTDPSMLQQSPAKGTMENTKFFSSLAGLHSNMQDQINNRDRIATANGDGYRINGKGQLNRSLKNLSIITRSNSSSSPQKGLRQLQQEPNHDFSKPLYKRYFRENADTFIRLLQDPYDPKLRRTLQKSDTEYSKFLQSYFSKVQIANENKKLQSTCIIPPDKKGQFLQEEMPGSFEGRDLLALNKEQNQIEKRCIDQIGDLDNYSPDHVIQSLAAHGSKGVPSTIAVSSPSLSSIATTMNTTMNSGHHLSFSAKPARRRVQRSQLPKSMINMSQNSGFPQTKSAKESVTGSFIASTAPGSAGNNTTGIKQQQSQPPSSASQQAINGRVGSSASLKLTVAGAAAAAADDGTLSVMNATKNSISNNNNGSNVNNNNYFSSKKKLENLEKKGYYIIKRNISEHFNKSMVNDDLLHEESDDSANASRTEATLDVLYSETIAIQNRLVQPDNQDGLIRKLKQMIKLEAVKKNVIHANLYKLEHK